MLVEWSLSECLIKTRPGVDEIFCELNNKSKYKHEQNNKLPFLLPPTCDAHNVTVGIRMWEMSCWMVQTHSWLWLCICVWQKRETTSVQVWKRPAGTYCTHIDRFSLSSASPDPHPLQMTATMWPGWQNMESDCFTGSKLSPLSGSPCAATERWLVTEHDTGWKNDFWSYDHINCFFSLFTWIIWKHHWN